MVLSQEALERLQAGNQRFVSGVQSLSTLSSRARRSDLVAGQAPFAIILGCSDSRVPAEIVFDQGLGDLFVIRVAGNIVAPSLVGSVEFAADKFGTRLVVVLGHSHCGAIQATLEELERPSVNRSPNLHSIVDRIRPSVQGLLETELNTTMMSCSARRCGPIFAPLLTSCGMARASWKSSSPVMVCSWWGRSIRWKQAWWIFSMDCRIF